ncbi:L-ribulose-5-phosphate 4-epimerase [Candidatus Epulonipiscium fishelsonii]|uniref:L-ribulose-5-phosphate 4-epimerase n=1 Tax=Candidatus Epulonipiscium fishelsonii TaxID=77094 RepID=A0ACC8X9X0_9FIRM|nr:L-ribulose-5-phosphate 4-epimerase [Epulopiscium sp. SCG-B11WGA-EpuloA1]ONI41728.1 L-ribulose-5-phosphate 4-epimerase [Epulopiscium sp. SCG-B05WGA-EpuloA1]
MTLQEIKENVFDANLELVRRGLVIYTWGNVSMIDREKGIIVIKPRGIEYADLCADDMSVTDLDGNLVEGTKLLPSVDLDIHIAIYKQFKEVQAIAHTHSTHATAFAQARLDIPCLGTTHADHFYGPIPCTRALTKEETATDYEKHTGDVVVETFLERKIDPMQVFGVNVAGHGPFTWGSTSALAVENSVILEELSRMAILTRQLKSDSKLLEDYALDKHFLRKHGKNSYFYQSK